MTRLSLVVGFLAALVPSFTYAVGLKIIRNSYSETDKVVLERAPITSIEILGHASNDPDSHSEAMSILIQAGKYSCKISRDGAVILHLASFLTAEDKDKGTVVCYIQDYKQRSGSEPALSDFNAYNFEYEYRMQ